MLGFVAGIAAALLMTAIGTQQTLSPGELHFFWPTAVFGVDFNDWWDGNAWHFLRLLLIFGGNGLIYALAAACFGALVELLRR